MGHRRVVFGDLLEMYSILADHYTALGENERARTLLEIALEIYKATERDFAAGRFRSLYEAFSDEAVRIEQKLRCL